VKVEREARIAVYAFGIQAREIRKALGLTQAEVAHRAAIDHTALSRIEAGGQNVTLITAHRIAAALGKRLVVEIE
jgi:HTH-type transcriptional regulator/antitoxin HipB